MQLSALALLPVARDLYARPRDMARFKAYLDTMTRGSGDVLLPIVAMNPMAKGAAPAMVERLIAMDAEAAMLAALDQAGNRLSDVQDALQVGLVVADDLEGMWSDRDRTRAAEILEDKGMSRRGFATPLIFTSEDPDPALVKARTLAAVYRVLHIRRHGLPRSLRDALRLIARTEEFAGEPRAAVSPREAAILRGHLDATAFPLVYAALMGDDAARHHGYDALGLAAEAGLRLARHIVPQDQDPVHALLGPRKA